MFLNIKYLFSFIELLVTKTQSNIDSQILFFDQFALMLFHGFLLDKTFVVIILLIIIVLNQLNNLLLYIWYLVCCIFGYEKKLSI